MGTQNVLQSLKTLDPAFAIIEDNQFGSDPNRLPSSGNPGKVEYVRFTGRARCRPEPAVVYP